MSEVLSSALAIVAWVVLFEATFRLGRRFFRRK